MTIELTDEQKIKLLNSDDVYSVMQEILLREEKIDQEKEHFWMIGMAVNHRILYIELVSLGSVKATQVEPMNVYRVAVLKGAINVIMIHNHPSGELKPSDADKDITDRLIQVGKILGMTVIDHLIITNHSYMSFADYGLLAELEKSTKWVPQYELVERIRNEEQKIREEAVKLAEGKGIKKGIKQGIKKGEVEKAIKIALNMKNKGYLLADIIELTGLTKEDIEKLN
jgi:DNA repair protein RadC